MSYSTGRAFRKALESRLRMQSLQTATWIEGRPSPAGRRDTLLPMPSVEQDAMKCESLPFDFHGKMRL